jgi:hypothetical protein
MARSPGRGKAAGQHSCRDCLDLLLTDAEGFLQPLRERRD